MKPIFYLYYNLHFKCTISVNLQVLPLLNNSFSSRIRCYGKLLPTPGNMVSFGDKIHINELTVSDLLYRISLSLLPQADRVLPRCASERRTSRTALPSTHSHRRSRCSLSPLRCGHTSTSAVQSVKIRQMIQNY